MLTQFAARLMQRTNASFIAAPSMGEAIKRFARSKIGNVAVIFGVTMFPILMAAGVAVDLSRALIVRERLGQALDAAALAVGGTPGLTEQDQQQLADDYFDANYPAVELGVPGNITITTGEDTVYMSASADVPTTLMNIFGLALLTVNSETEVTKESKGLEVVMVLDNTGSMSGSKIVALRDAATDLVEILFGPQESPELLKVGMVPFAAGVNVGTEALTDGWIDEDAQSTLAGHQFSAGVNVLDLYDQIPNRSWNGCIETRILPFDTTDDGPTPGNPETLWLPFFSPDHPDIGSGYDNKYLNDEMGGAGNHDARQRNDAKYDGSSASGSSKGPLRECTVTPITPLTNVKEDLLDAIDDMGASGYTHIPVGMVWGWRVLSPTTPYTEGVEYDDEDWNKAIILLTDGVNTVDTESTHNTSNYSAYGFLNEGRLGPTSSSAFVDEIDTNLTTVCDSVKATEIRVYTITFQLSDPDIKAIMEDCASESELYFDSPTNEDLQATFQAIAKDLSNLRLSL